MNGWNLKSHLFEKENHLKQTFMTLGLPSQYGPFFGGGDWVVGTFGIPWYQAQVTLPTNPDLFVATPRCQPCRCLRISRRWRRFVFCWLVGQASYTYICTVYNYIINYFWIYIEYIMHIIYIYVCVIKIYICVLVLHIYVNIHIYSKTIFWIWQEMGICRDYDVSTV